MIVAYDYRAGAKAQVSEAVRRRILELEGPLATAAPGKGESR